MAFHQKVSARQLYSIIFAALAAWMITFDIVLSPVELIQVSEEGTPKNTTSTLPTTPNNNRTTAAIAIGFRNESSTSVQSDAIPTSNSNRSGVAVPFVPWKQRRNQEQLPCFFDEQPMDGYTQKQPSDSGLLYVKIEKTASTTLASVAARTAMGIGRRHFNNSTMCRFRGFAHLWSTRTTQPFSERDHTKTFLWTFLKDPTQQALSMYRFFHIDWAKKGEYGMKSFREFFDEGEMGVFQAQKISRHELRTAFPKLSNHKGKVVTPPGMKLHDNQTTLENFVRSVISDMDFIGIVERLDESLVLLSFMLDVPVTDVLYTSSKVSGGYITKFSNSKSCSRMGYPRPLTPAMQAFLDSPFYKERMKIDRALYDAVHRSLDATIDTIVGRDRFDERLNEFKQAKQAVHDHCAHKLVLACDANGMWIPRRRRSKCYGSDVGCGYRCLDEVFPVGGDTGNATLAIRL